MCGSSSYLQTAESCLTSHKDWKWQHWVYPVVIKYVKGLSKSLLCVLFSIPSDLTASFLFVILLLCSPSEMENELEIKA